MKILFDYLRKYWRLCILVIVLAVINQVFALLEPMIFQRIIDDYALRFDELTRAEFFKGTLTLLGAFVGTALISRIAKNFQDNALAQICIAKVSAIPSTCHMKSLKMSAVVRHLVSYRKPAKMQRS